MPTRRKSFAPGPVVAIVGRTNVGKSSLFNRLIEEAKALISPVPGTTRDRNYGLCVWRGTTLVFIDTGGLDVATEDRLEAEVVRQAKIAIAEAELILFVVDLRVGILPQERVLAAEFKKTSKPIILVGNKADNPSLRALVHEPEWKALGWGEPLPVSAENGSGAGDLLDEILKAVPAARQVPAPLLDKQPIQLAIIGRPNVGKSSLVNALLKEERVIVSDIPHTTREPEDSLLLYDDTPYILIDTAGIRKRSKIGRGVEKTGVKKSLLAARRADVIVLVLDVGDYRSIQDRHLAGVALEAVKPLLVVANKWDLIPRKTPQTINEIAVRMRGALPFLEWAPLIFVSAKTSDKVEHILEEAKKAQAAYETVIANEDLEKFLAQVTHPSRSARPQGVRHPKVLAIRQRGSRPPTFEIAVREKKPLAPAYARFLEKRLRAHFNLYGTPVIMKSKGVRL